MKLTKRFKGKNLAGFIALMLFMAVFTGCPRPVPYDPAAEFEFQIDELIAKLMAAENYSSIKNAPVAVMPGSLKDGTRFARLEEVVMEKLSIRLRQTHDIYTLSRQNWFEFREGRPLTFLDKPYTKRYYLRDLIVYEVKVSADEVLGRATVSIMASDAEGKAVSGMMASCNLPFYHDSPARRLFFAEPSTNPYPEGLEERPYTSLDRLSFSLAAELADAYMTGLSADGQKPDDREVRVLLYSKPPLDVGSDLVYKIQNSLQQAVVSNKGFACVVSRDDFGPAFEQIDFYKRNYDIFRLEETKLTAGTVLLMVDSSRHSDGDKVGIALRALWRVGPQESETGDLIPTNVAGTYLSGFTAKAYLHEENIGWPDRRPPARTTYTPPKTTHTPPRTASPPRPPVYAEDLDVCFYDFTEVFEKRIYPVLNNAPNVKSVRRLYDACEGSSCLCYALSYTGPREALESHIREKLRTNKVLSFRMVSKGPNRLDVLFNAGFE